MTQTLTRCPHCDGLIDPSINFDGRTEPRDWMPCLCSHCGEISTFEHTAPGGLRVSTAADWEAWAEDPVLVRALDVAKRASERLKEPPT
jgi:RNase P subunit RPR2